MNLAADAASLGMELWDMKKDEVWMTEKGRALFGFEPDAHLDSAAIVARVHPDDRAAREVAIKKSIETQGEYETLYRVVLPNGHLRWIGTRGRSLGDRNGKVSLLFGASIDVTRQRYAEDRFKLVVEASPNGIVLVNEDGLIALLNAYAEKLFGYKREEIIGQPIETLLPERFQAQHPNLRAEFLAAPTARSMGVGRELFARRKDGTETPVVIEPDPSLPLVKGNPVLLQQVLLNIIINAFDAMEKTPPGKAARDCPDPARNQRRSPGQRA